MTSRRRKPSSTLLCLCSLVGAALAASDGMYSERLLMRPLPDGKVLSHFEFTSNASIADWDTYQTTETITTFQTTTLPRSLTSIIRAYDVEEIHLTLTSGRWDYTRWRYPVEHGSPSGGEILAWIAEYHDDKEDSLTQKWTGLTNALGGLFCSSLNNLDEKLTASPVDTFSPKHLSAKDLPFFHALLPLEHPCTENLTPFANLLPCRTNNGLASLLNPHKLFDANWQKLGIHVSRNRKNQELEILLEFEVVQDPVRMRLSGGSQPRREWSLQYLFGRRIRGTCPVSTSSIIEVDLDPLNSGSDYSLEPVHSYILSPSGRTAIFEMSKDIEPPHVSMEWPVMHFEGFEYPMTYLAAPIVLERINTGYGLERGRLGVEISNQQASNNSAVWLEEWPWWIKVYMHTLDVTVNGVSVPKESVIRSLRYTQAQSRERPTVIEASLELPASSVVRIIVDIDKAYLRYTDYPPDAMRGLDVPSAILLLQTSEEESRRRIYSASTLLDMPTPDFSMPYNVIIMTSTVMALFFGSIFNLLTRTWMIVELEDKAELDSQSSVPVAVNDDKHEKAD